MPLDEDAARYAAARARAARANELNRRRQDAEAMGRFVEEPITARNIREYGSIFDPADFADLEDIAASTRRRGVGAYSTDTGTVRRTPPRARFPTDAEYRAIQFQNFLNNIDTQSRQGARIQEFVNKNPQLAQQIFNTSLGLRSKVSGTQKKLAGISNNIYQAADNFRAKYHDGRFIPDFIANPLGLNNPLVEAGGLIKEGTRLNPQGLTFLKEQKDLGSVLDQMQLDAMAGKVTASYFSRNVANPKLNIAFQSASGYTDPSSLKKEKAQAAAEIQRLENELNAKNITERKRKIIQRDLELQNRRFKNFSTQLSVSQQALEANPLTSEAIRYQLGSVISAAPEGTMITASPIGGPSGGRS